MRLHFMGLHPSRVPAHVRSLANTLTLTGVALGSDNVDLPTYVQYMVALRWLMLCGEVRLHNLEVVALGASTQSNVERYAEMLVRRPDEAAMRSRYLKALRAATSEVDWGNSEDRNIELLSLAWRNETLMLGPLAHFFPDRLRLDLRKALERIELARTSYGNKLEMIVDEGVAEWHVLYHKRDEENVVRPIIPLALKPSEDAQSKRQWSVTNPYRRGLELLLQVEEKLGVPYVRLAAQIACAPARQLTNCLSVRNLKAADETAPWHPTSRLQRIADLSEEEVSKVRNVRPPLRIVALCDLLDRRGPPLSSYACDELDSFLREKK